MLALTRKKGQSIQIGDDIFIHINDLNSYQVRLGIHAPPHINIVRTELIEGKKDSSHHLQSDKPGI